ncbi:hypothetical protein P154DRAFT_565310 [Amniculicola lignicola CBS 123094]|uniref:Uncharacterized protein n=1 Tax=Amniculicola lignicola CBS 123094 TaxID=1392246 RepID=A0A6A5W822_9PLEO|nr:hypothetical protein P154DRAFT_565310 [Amniculicola lignicola CBS 123094]
MSSDTPPDGSATTPNRTVDEPTAVVEQSTMPTLGGNIANKQPTLKWYVLTGHLSSEKSRRKKHISESTEQDILEMLQLHKEQDRELTRLTDDEMDEKCLLGMSFAKSYERTLQQNQLLSIVEQAFRDRKLRGLTTFFTIKRTFGAMRPRDVRLEHDNRRRYQDSSFFRNLTWFDKCSLQAPTIAPAIEFHVTSTDGRHKGSMAMFRVKDVVGGD